MKATIVSDLIIMRDSIVSSIIVFVVIGVIMSFSMGAISAAACIGATSVLSPVLTLVALDEANGWERLRATLPISRRDTIFGRYASIAIIALGGSLFAVVFMLLLQFAVIRRPLLWIIEPFGGLQTAVALAAEPAGAIFAAAILGGACGLLAMVVEFPLIARFGMTKAIRFAPLMLVLIAVCLVGAADSSLFASSWFIDLEQSFASKPDLMLPLITGAIVAVVLVLYAASALFAAKIYEAREF